MRHEENNVSSSLRGTGSIVRINGLCAILGTQWQWWHDGAGYDGASAAKPAITTGTTLYLWTRWRDGSRDDGPRKNDGARYDERHAHDGRRDGLLL